MRDPLLRDKVVNLSNELNNFRLQLWQQELLVEDAQVEPPGEGADPVTVLTFSKLNNGVVDALAQAAALRRKISVREPKLKELQAALDAEEEAARKASA